MSLSKDLFLGRSLTGPLVANKSCRGESFSARGRVGVLVACCHAAPLFSLVVASACGRVRVLGVRWCVCMRVRHPDSELIGESARTGETALPKLTKRFSLGVPHHTSSAPWSSTLSLQRSISFYRQTRVS